MIRFLPVVLLLVAPASSFAESISERIVAYCQKNVDQQVGDGECYALAAKAVEAAGGRHQSKFKDHPNEDDYVWGKLVASYEMTKAGPKQSGKASDIRPGDIIQYRDTKWKGNFTYGHHTAVVGAVKEGSTKIDIFHQNVNGKRIVLADSLDFAGLESGWVRIYRAQAK